MIKVFQTKFGDGRGNCFQACLASLLELSLEDVPDFCNLYGDGEWFIETNKWLEEKFGLALCDVRPERLQEDSWLTYDGKDVFTIAGGLTEDKVQHVVILKNGELAHDPHPGWNDLKKYNELMVFVAKDPVKVMRKNT